MGLLWEMSSLPGKVLQFDRLYDRVVFGEVLEMMSWIWQSLN